MNYRDGVEFYSKIPQVNGIEALEEIADEIRNRLDKKY